MERRRIFIALSLFLSGCATEPMTQAQLCPVPERWSRDEMKALGAALAPLPEASPILRLALDWQAMRDELRACRERR